MKSSLFTQHSWFELWGPGYFVLSLLIIFLYFYKIVHPYRMKITSAQKSYFILSMILLYGIKGSPIATAAKKYLFSGHVLQLSVIFFVIVPLVLLSLPRSFIRTYLWDHRARFLLKILGRPWINLILFNGLVTVYFIPPIFNVIVENIFLSFLAQTLLIFLAFVMWWVIISPLPEISYTPYMTRIIYIFFASLLLMPIGIFFLIIQKEYYPMYAQAITNLFPSMTGVYDQQLAGGILKVAQLSSYIFALLNIVLTWGKEEEEKEGEVDEENIRVVQGIVIHLKDNK